MTNSIENPKMYENKKKGGDDFINMLVEIHACSISDRSTFASEVEVERTRRFEVLIGFHVFITINPLALALPRNIPPPPPILIVLPDVLLFRFPCFFFL